MQTIYRDVPCPADFPILTVLVLIMGSLTITKEVYPGISHCYSFIPNGNFPKSDVNELPEQ